MCFYLALLIGRDSAALVDIAVLPLPTKICAFLLHDTLTPMASSSDVRCTLLRSEEEYLTAYWHR